MTAPAERRSGKVMHKFPLQLGGWGVLPSVMHYVDMPAVSTVLALQLQHDVPTLWAQVDPSTRAVTRVFQWVGTGDEVPYGGQYVGTVQLQDGKFVFHLFEVSGKDGA